MHDKSRGKIGSCDLAATTSLPQPLVAVNSSLRFTEYLPSSPRAREILVEQNVTKAPQIHARGPRLSKRKRISVLPATSPRANNIIPPLPFPSSLFSQYPPRAEMAYNAVAQREHDALSDPPDSPPESPQEHHGLIFQPLSIDLVPFSPLSGERDPNDSRRESISLQHPMPDLQSLQGAYLANVERLEQSAERLSMSSDIGEELRKLKMEQRKSDSRRSSVPEMQGEDSESTVPGNRQFSYEYGSHASNSIIGTNNVARSGGFSSEAYFASPRSSIRSETWSRSSVKGRATSQGSRLTQLQGAEQDHKAFGSMTSAGLITIPPPPESSSKILKVVNNERDADGIEVPRPLNVSPRRLHDATEAFYDRPTTAISTGTSHQVEVDGQAEGFFQDFDGIHATPQRDGTAVRKSSVSSRRAFSDRPQSFLQPLPRENMVYYPAPVPMILNLPPRLSKMSPPRDKRRANVFSELPSIARNSAPWFPDSLDKGDEESRSAEDQPDVRSESGRNRRTMANMPPQLRANLFFEHPPTHQDIEVKGQSAVETLDRILDASVTAPVTAFIDHPIVGHIGAEVYGKSVRRSKFGNDEAEMAHHRKRRSSGNRLQKRPSASDLLEGKEERRGSFLGLGEQLRGRRKSGGRAVSGPSALDEAGAASLHSEETPLQELRREDPRQTDVDAVHEEVEFHDAQEFASDNEHGDDGERNMYTENQPTTLLAELQYRKAHQKQRNRTAAIAFPDGMHSTLLQLDAVADVQRQSRRQKHVTLAWEDPSVQQSRVDMDDDEDVPLGMLFPGQKVNGQNRGSQYVYPPRPLGLIAKREMEDNEPLSRRRARLRGEEIIPQPLTLDRRASMYTLNVSSGGMADNAIMTPEVENETLAQRAERLRQRNPASQPRLNSGNFTNEITSQFNGLTTDTSQVVNGLPSSKTPDLEETLGQRRKRLQAEREAKSRQVSGEGDGVAAKPPQLSNRHSMANLLQAHPAAGARGPPTVQQTQWTIMQQQQAPSNYLAMASGMGLLGHPGASGMGHMANPGLNNYTPNPLVYSHSLVDPSGRVSYGGGTTGLQAGQPPMELDPRQRATIDRWRQSVMY